MAVSASICMPSITARKSSWRRSKRCTAATRTRVTGSVRLAAVEAGDALPPGGQFGQLGGEGALLVGDVVDHAAEGVDRVHGVAPVRRQHAHAAIERGAGGAHDRLDRVEVGLGGVSGVMHPSPTGIPLPRSGGGLGRGRSLMPATAAPQPTRRRVALGQSHPARHRVAASQPSCQPMRQADDQPGLQPAGAGCASAAADRPPHDSAHRRDPTTRRTPPAVPASGCRAVATRSTATRPADSSDPAQPGPSRSPADGSAPAATCTAHPTARMSRDPRHADRARAVRRASPSSGSSRTARPSPHSAAWSRRAGTRSADRANGAASRRFRPGSRADAARSANPSSRRPSSTSSIASSRAIFSSAARLGEVRDIVGVAGERIEGVYVRAQVAADQQRADRKILVAAILAGPRLDRRGIAHAPAP